MRTWILCADTLCAKIYQMKAPSDDAHLAYTIPCPKKGRSSRNIQGFIRELSELVEIACGAGTESQLILCAEPKLLSKIYKLLSAAVKGVVIGRVEKDLCLASSEAISDSSHAILNIPAHEALA